VPRAASLEIWQKLQPIVERGILGPRIQLVQPSSHKNAAELGSYLAEQCSTVRGDKGQMVENFLLFLDELTHDTVPSAKLSKSQKRLMLRTKREAQSQLVETWIEHIRIHEGESTF